MENEEKQLLIYKLKFYKFLAFAVTSVLIFLCGVMAYAVTWSWGMWRQTGEFDYFLITIGSFWFWATIAISIYRMKQDKHP